MNGPKLCHHREKAAQKVHPSSASVENFFKTEAQKKLEELQNLKQTKEQFYRCLFQYFEDERNRLLARICKDQERTLRSLKSIKKIMAAYVKSDAKYRAYFISNEFIQMKAEAQMYREQLLKKKIKTCKMQIEMVRNKTAKLMNHPRVVAKLAKQAKMEEIEKKKQLIEAAKEKIAALKEQKLDRAQVKKETIEVNQAKIVEIVMALKEIALQKAKLAVLKKQIEEAEAEKKAKEEEEAKQVALMAQNKQSEGFGAHRERLNELFLKIKNSTGQLPLPNPFSFQCRAQSLANLFKPKSTSKSTPKMKRVTDSGATKRKIQSEPKPKAAKRVRFSDEVKDNERTHGEPYHAKQLQKLKLDHQEKIQTRSGCAKSNEAAEGDEAVVQQETGDVGNEEQPVHDESENQQQEIEVETREEEKTENTPSAQPEPKEQESVENPQPSTSATPKRSSLKRTGTPIVGPPPKLQATQAMAITPKLTPEKKALKAKSPVTPKTPKGPQPIRRALRSTQTPPQMKQLSDSPGDSGQKPASRRGGKSVKPKTPPEAKKPTKQVTQKKSPKKMKQDENIDSSNIGDDSFNFNTNESNDSDSIFGLSKAKDESDFFELLEEERDSGASDSIFNSKDNSKTSGSGNGFFLNDGDENGDNDPNQNDNTDDSDFFGLNKGSNSLIF